ncbi:hypothetical protein H8E88_19275 [candidate division KSB1 bacterium]|nr:hypothetical protein [candidate division KSB1 bacterium]
MRIYWNPLEMIKEVERDLYEMGTRYQTATVQDQKVANDPDFMTIELYAYGYTLTSFSDITSMIEHTHPNDKEYVKWINYEIIERTNQQLYPLNPGKAWMERENFWKQFIRNGVFSYSYAERWQQQIPYIINELKRFPNTRQAIITMYDQHQDMLNWGGLDRVPCSLSYQFLIRNDMLHCIYSQRSCDFIKFFAADVAITIGLLKYIASKLGIKYGYFTHFLGSLHAFAGDLKGRDIF